LLSKSSAEIVDAPDLTVHVDIDGPGFERYAATIQSDWVLAEWNADIGGRLMIGAATKAERAEVREQVEATPIAARIHGDLPESTVVVTGPDLEQLAVLSEQLGSAFRELEGVHAVQDDVRQVATSSFRVDRHALAKFGLQHEQVRRAAAAADGGVEVDSVVRGVDGLPIRVRTTDAMLVAPNGDLMHLSAVVAHTRSTGPAVIQRINGRRAVTLTVQVRGEVSLAKVQQALRALIADVGLPVGYAVTIE
jgi:multidrug efflux pump subunit AcrB